MCGDLGKGLRKQSLLAVRSRGPSMIVYLSKFCLEGGKTRVKLKLTLKRQQSSEPG